MTQEIVPPQGLTEADHTRYEIVIRNRETGQEHVFRADEHEILWERGRLCLPSDEAAGFTGKERVTIKAWRGFRSWHEFVAREYPMGKWTYPF